MTFIPLHSKWLGRRKGQPVIFEVVGIWCTGTLQTYQPLVYELQAELTSDIIKISRE